MVFNMMEQEIVAAVEDPYGEMGDTEENSAKQTMFSESLAVHQS